MPLRADLAVQIRVRIPMRGTPERSTADLMRESPKTTMQVSKNTALLWGMIRDKYNGSCRTPSQRVSSLDELLYFIGSGRVQIAPYPVEGSIGPAPAADRPEIPLPAAASARAGL